MQMKVMVMISIRILKICDSAIVKPLSIIFNNCINQNVFPYVWKKSSICHIHKKGGKHLIITNHNHCYQFVGKCLKDQSLIQYMNMLQKTNCYQSINLIFGLIIHVWISYYRLFITYEKLLILLLLLKNMMCF